MRFFLSIDCLPLSDNIVGRFSADGVLIKHGFFTHFYAKITNCSTFTQFTERRFVFYVHLVSTPRRQCTTDVYCPGQCSTCRVMSVEGCIGVCLFVKYQTFLTLNTKQHIGTFIYNRLVVYHPSLVATGKLEHAFPSWKMSATSLPCEYVYRPIGGTCTYR